MHLFKQITNPFFVKCLDRHYGRSFHWIGIFLNRLSDATYLNFLTNILSLLSWQIIDMYMYNAVVWWSSSSFWA